MTSDITYLQREMTLNYETFMLLCMKSTEEKLILTEPSSKFKRIYFPRPTNMHPFYEYTLPSCVHSSLEETAKKLLTRQEMLVTFLQENGYLVI